MFELFKVFIDIALWRKGPQHLPASGFLLLLVIVVYLGVSLTFGTAIDLPGDRVVARTFLELVIGLLWMWLLLAIFGRRARFQQSATALIGTAALLAPLVIGLQALLIRAGESNPLTAPLVFTLITVGVWYLLITAHIVRSALDVKLFVAMLLTLVYVGCEYLITNRLLTLTA